MAIPSLTKTATASEKDYIYNPNGQLDKDAFMQLFLKELELQDPTDPMDTDKMLEQTAYLSTMEMNNNMQNTLNNLSNVLLQNSQLGAINAIGKIGDTGNRYINITDEDISKTFELYFGDDITSGEVIIKDKNGNIIKTFPLEAHTKGILSFEWDLTDSDGNRVKSDTYMVEAVYYSPDGKEHKTALGAYPIESIKFDNNEALAKLGSMYIPLSQIKEIYEWQG